MDELYQNIGQLYLELVKSKGLIQNLNTNLVAVVKQFEDLNIKYQKLEKLAADGGVDLGVMLAEDNKVESEPILAPNTPVSAPVQHVNGIPQERQLQNF